MLDLAISAVKSNTCNNRWFSLSVVDDWYGLHMVSLHLPSLDRCHKMPPPRRARINLIPQPQELARTNTSPSSDFQLKVN